MRILVATLRYPPYVAGGYEILTRDAVLGLRARGHDVRVVCGKGRRLEGEEGVFPVFEPALPEEDDAKSLFELSHRGTNLERFRLHFLRRSNVRAMRRALRESNAELVLFFNLGLVSLAPLVAARAEGVPTLGFVSDPWPLNHWVRDWQERPESARKRLRLGLLRRAWRFYRGQVGLGPLLVSSDYLRRQLADDGVPAESMALLRVPLAPEMMPDPRPSDPARRSPGERLRVVCASMLWEGKGVHVLLEAAAQASAAGADLELFLAGEGEGPYRERLARLADADALRGRVHWLGLLDRAGTAERIASSHVLCCPSVWGEPFPTTTIEGMAQGVALVASDAGGTPEQFADGVEGLLVPAGDAPAMAEALRRMASDEDLRVACGRAGLARVAADYTMDRFLDGIEAAASRAAQTA